MPGNILEPDIRFDSCKYDQHYNISKKISDHYKNLYQCTDISDANYKTHMMNNIKIINITQIQFDEINNMFYELPIKNKFVENVIKNNNTPLLDFKNVNVNLKSIDKYTIIKTTLKKIVNPFKKERKNNILYKISTTLIMLFCFFHCFHIRYSIIFCILFHKFNPIVSHYI